ncbi:MAG: hypothetical protein K0U78_15845 [Actinomycetia bacterium]|nr:hypothetical protein [Actinomycetes bacterium]
MAVISHRRVCEIIGEQGLDHIDVLSVDEKYVLDSYEGSSEGCQEVVRNCEREVTGRYVIKARIKGKRGSVYRWELGQLSQPQQGGASGVDLASHIQLATELATLKAKEEFRASQPSDGLTGLVKEMLPVIKAGLQQRGGAPVSGVDVTPESELKLDPELEADIITFLRTRPDQADFFIGQMREMIKGDEGDGPD